MNPFYSNLRFKAHGSGEFALHLKEAVWISPSSLHLVLWECEWSVDVFTKFVCDWMKHWQKVKVSGSVGGKLQGHPSFIRQKLDSLWFPCGFAKWALLTLLRYLNRPELEVFIILGLAYHYEIIWFRIHPKVRLLWSNTSFSLSRFSFRDRHWTLCPGIHQPFLLVS